MGAKKQSMWAMLGVKVQMELIDLLLSKEVWLAVLGAVVAIAMWRGWAVPTEVFIAIEALIVAVILALKGTSVSAKDIKTAQGWCWCD